MSCKLCWVVVATVALVCVPSALHCEMPAEQPADSLVEPEATDDDSGEVEGVMIDISEREMPSDAEWQALHEDVERSAFAGGLADFKSKVINHMNTRYFTLNADNATLCSFGKMGKDQRYDRYGQIEGVEFEIDTNQWKKRFVIDGKALARLAGSRLMEFVGVGLQGDLNSMSKIEVTFIGTAVPKAEVIHRLNENVEALQYFDVLQQKRAAYEKKDFKLFAGDSPPAPKVVLANVVMLDGEFSKALDASVDGKLHSRVLGDGIELSITKQNGERMCLLSPVVRCYRTYSVEFKTDAGGRPVRVALADRNGNQHMVPQVFDLTPDL